jgi:hypothetical protein
MNNNKELEQAVFIVVLSMAILIGMVVILL